MSRPVECGSSAVDYRSHVETSFETVLAWIRLNVPERRRLTFPRQTDRRDKRACALLDKNGHAADGIIREINGIPCSFRVLSVRASRIYPSRPRGISSAQRDDEIAALSDRVPVSLPDAVAKRRRGKREDASHPCTNDRDILKRRARDSRVWEIDSRFSHLPRSNVASCRGCTTGTQ